MKTLLLVLLLRTIVTYAGSCLDFSDTNPKWSGSYEGTCCYLKNQVCDASFSILVNLDQNRVTIKDNNGVKGCEIKYRYEEEDTVHLGFGKHLLKWKYGAQPEKFIGVLGETAGLCTLEKKKMNDLEILQKEINDKLTTLQDKLADQKFNKISPSETKKYTIHVIGESHVDEECEKVKHYLMQLAKHKKIVFFLESPPLYWHYSPHWQTYMYAHRVESYAMTTFGSGFRALNTMLPQYEKWLQWINKTDWIKKFLKGLREYVKLRKQLKNENILSEIDISSLDPLDVEVGTLKYILEKLLQNKTINQYAAHENIDLLLEQRKAMPICDTFDDWRNPQWCKKIKKTIEKNDNKNPNVDIFFQMGRGHMNFKWEEVFQNSSLCKDDQCNLIRYDLQKKSELEKLYTAMKLSSEQTHYSSWQYAWFFDKHTILSLLQKS